MNKKILSLFAAVSTAVAAASGNITPFKAALDKVDQGGEFLSVTNTYHLKQLAAAPTVPVTMQNIGEVAIARLQKALGMSLVQAQATSSIEAAPGCWVFKSYQYIGKENMQLPSIFKLINTPDAELDFAALPADTALAISGNLDMAGFYKLLEKEFTSQEDQFKQIFMQLPAIAAQRNIDLDALLKSLSGKWKIVIAGSSPMDLLINIEIPDKNGVLAACLRREFKLPSNAKAGMLPILFMPLKFTFGKQKITFSTIKTNRQSKAVLAQNPDFANYISRIGSKGIGYMLLNVTPQLIATVKAMIPAQISSVVELAPFSILNLSKNDDAGFYTVSAANVSGTKMAFSTGTTILNGILLPALQQARDRAKVAGCLNNLRMIGLGLILYNDVHEKLPAPNGIAGLQLLVDKGFSNIDVFKCKSKPVQYQDKKLTADCPYIYIGGIVSGNLDKVQNPAQLPLVFEKPNHKQQCPVVFADGHAEVLTIKPAYTNPNQVIGELSKRFKYAPELLDKMLRAIMEN